MKVVRGLEQAERDPAAVVTVGTFDGVHRGHQAILRRCAQRAGEAGGRSILLTFDPHPRTVVRPEAPPLRTLTTLDERTALIEATGMDVMVVAAFTPAFAALTAEEFVREVLVGKVGVRHMVVGHDHHFGKGRQAGVEQLRALGAGLGFTVEQVAALTVDGITVSSTAIRRALESGDVALAEKLLGRPYAMRGLVVRGDRRGATIGFPTANLDPVDTAKVLPARGVYVVEARIGTRNVGGMMNIGVRPTIGRGLQETREVHLLDFQGELYDQQIDVRFLDRLREERPFPSVQALMEQLGRDRAETRRRLQERTHVQNHASYNTEV